MIHEIAVLIVAREEAGKKPGADANAIREEFNAGVRKILDSYGRPKAGTPSDTRNLTAEWLKNPRSEPK